MKKFLMISAGVMTLAASGYAVASPGMAKMDANGDGNVTRAEATASSDAMFQKMDVNQDGRIDEADGEAKKRARFDEIDTDNNGQITQAEMAAHRQAAMAEREARMAERRAERFAAMDADSNQSLSFAEYGDGREGMRGPRAEGGDRAERKGPGKRHGKWSGPGRHGGKMMFEKADANDDGAVTAAEMRTAALAQFDKADTNSDSTITQAERDAVREQMREAWKERRSNAE